MVNTLYCVSDHTLETLAHNLSDILSKDNEQYRLLCNTPAQFIVATTCYNTHAVLLGTSKPQAIRQLPDRICLVDNYVLGIHILSDQMVENNINNNMYHIKPVLGVPWVTIITIHNNDSVDCNIYYLHDNVNKTNTTLIYQLFCIKVNSLFFISSGCNQDNLIIDASMLLTRYELLQYMISSKSVYNRQEQPMLEIEKLIVRYTSIMINKNLDKLSYEITNKYVGSRIDRSTLEDLQNNCEGLFAKDIYTLVHGWITNFTTPFDIIGSTQSANIQDKCFSLTTIREHLTTIQTVFDKWVYALTSSRYRIRQLEGKSTFAKTWWKGVIQVREERRQVVLYNSNNSSCILTLDDCCSILTIQTNIYRLEVPVKWSFSLPISESTLSILLNCVLPRYLFDFNMENTYIACTLNNHIYWLSCSTIYNHEYGWKIVITDFQTIDAAHGYHCFNKPLTILYEEFDITSIKDVRSAIDVVQVYYYTSPIHILCSGLWKHYKSPVKDRTYSHNYLFIQPVYFCSALTSSNEEVINIPYGAYFYLEYKNVLRKLSSRDGATPIKGEDPNNTSNVSILKGKNKTILNQIVLSIRSEVQLTYWCNHRDISNIYMDIIINCV